MQGRQDIDMKKDNKAAITDAKPEPGNKKVVFICRGGGLTVDIPNTQGAFKELLPDGTERTHVKPIKQLNFDNGMAETTDAEIVEKIQLHPCWNHDFYFHPRFIPEKYRTEQSVARAEQFMPGKALGRPGPDEYERKKDNAKYFDKNAHPIDGVEDPIDPETGKPDPAGGWS